MTFEIITPAELDDGLIDRWRALQAADPALAGPYFTPEYTQMIGAVRPKDSRVLLIKDGQEIVGFLPYRTGPLTAMPLGAPLCDYQGVIGAADLEIDPKAMLRAMGVGRLDFIHWITKQTSFAPYFHGHDISHSVDLSGGFQAYLEDKKASGSKFFQRTQKKIRKAERDVGAVVINPVSRNHDDFQTLIDWKQAQHQATNTVDIFAHKWVMEVFERALASDSPHMHAVVTTLHIGDGLAAASFNLCSASVMHGWLLGFNRDYAQHSPGLAKVCLMIEKLEDTPYRLLDFGSGDYRFKKEICNGGNAIAHGCITGHGPMAWSRQAFYGVRDLAESKDWGRFSHLPGKAMRRLDVYRGLYG